MCVRDEGSAGIRHDQRLDCRIGNLCALNLRGERRGAIDRHVVRIVAGGKCVAEGVLRETCQRNGVGGDGLANEKPPIELVDAVHGFNSPMARHGGGGLPDQTQAM